MQAVEKISEITHCAAFLSAPRFDQDFILEIKLLYIDQSRLLCVLVTDFGLIRTEVLYTDKKLSNFTLKRLETYFNWRLTGIEKPTLDPEEEAIGAKLYKELMLRHIVSYTNFSAEDLFQAGFSKLLAYPDFNDASALASGLSLFENKQMLRKLFSTTSEMGKLTCWIGDDLHPFSPEAYFLFRDRCPLPHQPDHLRRIWDFRSQPHPLSRTVRSATTNRSSDFRLFDQERV